MSSKSGLILPRNHLFLNLADDIDAILKPLKKHGVAYLTYFRTYPDNSQICISNSARWLDDYYQLGLYETSLYQDYCREYQTGYQLWPPGSDLPVFEVARQGIKSDYGVTLIKQHREYCEFYFLSGTTNAPEVLNFYINHLDVLERFTLFFQDKAQALLKQAESQRVILPEHQHLVVEPNTQRMAQTPVDQTRDELKIRHFRVPTGPFKDVKLTGREFECMLLMRQGKTKQEIADTMAISKRTVETHVDHLKVKFGCYRKADVVTLLDDVVLPEYW